MSKKPTVDEIDQDFLKQRILEKGIQKWSSNCLDCQSLLTILFKDGNATLERKCKCKTQPPFSVLLKNLRGEKNLQKKESDAKFWGFKAVLSKDEMLDKADSIQKQDLQAIDRMKARINALMK